MEPRKGRGEVDCLGIEIAGAWNGWAKEGRMRLPCWFCYEVLAVAGEQDVLGGFLGQLAVA